MRKTPQDGWAVPVETVHGLVDAFNARRIYTCSSYRPTELHAALIALPVEDGGVEFNAVAAVLTRFECHKLTGGCNRWTSWMRHRLREVKFRRGRAA